MALDLDEKELLLAVLDSPNWPVILKQVSVCLKTIEKRVLDYNLDDGPEGLVIAKARAEGAKQIFQDISAFKNAFLK